MLKLRQTLLHLKKLIRRSRSGWATFALKVQGDVLGVAHVY